MNKDKLDKILALVGLGAFTLTLVIQDWQIRGLNARVRRLEASEIFDPPISDDGFTETRKKED